MAKSKENYFQINSNVKLFQMLETLVCREDWDLAALAEQINIPKPTVLRMLLTLKSIGYVDQTEAGKRYYATTKLFEIGSKAIPFINVFKLAQPIMAKLVEKCDESVYLSVLSGIEIVVIAKISSRHYIRSDSYVGDRFLSYLSSGGKALLSAMTSDERAQLFKGHEFELRTHKGITTLDELEKDVTRTIARGYALIDEEAALGIRSVGVPILNHRCEPVAALSAAAPSARVPMEKIPIHGKLVVEAGKEISKKLGASNQLDLSTAS
jgi:IclR family KDG regulon transcriptional repressor